MQSGNVQWAGLSPTAPHVPEGLTLLALIVLATLFELCTEGSAFGWVCNTGRTVISMARNVAGKVSTSTARVLSSVLTGVAATIAASG